MRTQSEGRLPRDMNGDLPTSTQSRFTSLCHSDKASWNCVNRHLAKLISCRPWKFTHVGSTECWRQRGLFFTVSRTCTVFCSHRSQANRILSKILHNNHTDPPPPQKKINRLLWNPKAPYSVLNSQPLVPVLSYTNCPHPFYEIHFNIILPSTHRPFKWPLPFQISYHKFLRI